MSTESTASTKARVMELLDVAGIEFTVVHKGATVRDKWECDAWRCTFGKGTLREDFDYYTGTGHRKVPEWKAGPPLVGIYDGMRPPTRNTLKWHAWQKLAKAVPPAAADVLHALIRDAEAANQSFDDWCADLGYSTDSRKALDTYLACQADGTRLRRVLGADLMKCLSHLLENY
jgi:hypothetical protein